MRVAPKLAHATAGKACFYRENHKNGGPLYEKRRFFSSLLERHAVAVLVTHGRVSVTPEAHEPSASATVEPGPGRTRSWRSVSASWWMSPGSGRLHVTTPPAGEREELFAWRAPRVTFTGVSLAEAVSLLNRESSAQQEARFVIDDRSLAAVRISGLFRLDNTEAFVRLLDQGFGIVAERRSADEILLRRAP